MKIALIVIFFAVAIGIGILTRKNAGNVGDFILGGRKIGPWLTAFAYGTSYFSAVVFIGYAGQFGWKYGLASTWIGIGNALIGSLLAWVVLGKRTRIMTHSFSSATMPEFFGSRYDSSALKIVSSFIIFIFLIPYTASVYNGLSRLFEQALGIPYTVCIFAMALVTCLYVVLGGYMATALNDFFQGIIMIIGIIAVIIAVVNGQGGFAAAVSGLAAIEDTGVPAGSLASIGGPDVLNLIGVVILTSLGTWGLPQMVHKFYAIKDTKAIRIGTIISTGFAIIVAGGSYFLGGFGRLFADSIQYNPTTGTPVYDSIIPTMMTKLPDILVGIVIVLVLSASMSTLSSLVLTSSSTLTLDFIDGTIVKNMTEKKKLVIMRVMLVFFIIISAIIAYSQYNSPSNFIAQLMGISWGALAGAFLAPFLYGLYSKKVTRASVWACFAYGVGLTVLNMIFKFIASPINAGAIAIVGGLIIVPLVSLFTPKLPKEKVESMFLCYKKN